MLRETIPAIEGCCDTCEKPWSSPHPYAASLNRVPTATLPRKAPRSSTCMVCCDFIVHSFSLEVDTPKKRAKFKKDVTTNGPRKCEFGAKLVALIQRVNAEVQGGSTARPSLHRRRKHAAVEVDATESSGRRYTTRRACFWPMNVY